MKNLKLYFMLGFCTVSVTGCDAQIKPEQNKELANAAMEGTIFEGKKYLVITEETEVIRLEGKDTVRKDLQRGDVFENYGWSGLDGYNLIILQNDTTKWNLKQGNNDTKPSYIHQYCNTPFPVIGIVQDKSVLQYYDFDAKASKEMKLKKGTVYIWVIRKDGQYVNILDSDGTSHTGYLNENKLNILQKEDHLKVMNESMRKSMEEIWN